MTDAASIDRYVDEHLEQNLAELSRYVGQPSIAAQRLGMEDCAALVAAMLRTRGFAVDTIASDGAPVVVAEQAGRTDRTLLIYNHYDVQPPEPLELWTNPPFEPTLRDGVLFGRGVSDDKGHLTSRLLAIDALLAVRGELPCRVKWVVEGEKRSAACTCRRSSCAIASGSPLTPACGSSGSSTTAGSRSFTRGCAASATSSCRSRRRRSMRTPA